MFLHEAVKVETFPLCIKGKKCLNPSIAVHNGKLEVIVRTVNYTIDENGRYVMPSEDGETIKTTNFLADFEPNGGTISNVREIVDPKTRLPTLVIGYEDFRIASVRGERFASATVRDWREDMLCQIAVCRIADDGTVTRADAQPPVHPGRNEKNWMPRGGDALTFLYDVVTWADYNPWTGAVTLRPYFQSSFAPELSNARGGAIDNGGLAIIHETIHENGGQRIYRHRFVLYNEAGTIEAVSPLFSFQHVGIEFCAGVARHDGKVWLTYGVHDAEAFAASVDERELLTWICATPKPQPIVMNEEPPRFITTTLTNSQQAIIGDALRSAVDWADLCLVVDTGIKDDTLAVADQVCGPKLVTRAFTGRWHFSNARNFALQVAGELAGEHGWTNAWAVTLDSDERLVDGPPDTMPAADHILTPDKAQGYFKWRLFKLPARGHYRGATHEVYADGGSFENVPWMAFTELGKSTGDIQHKFERDLQMLKEETKAYPKDPRWWFYLGETYRNLKKHEQAIKAYVQCIELTGWDEEAAWASYQAATCYVELKDWRGAIRSCASGLAHFPGIPELPWLAGWCSLQIQDWAKAAMWARLAMAHGCFGEQVNRQSFRYALGMCDGPYAVLKAALEGLGRQEEANKAEELRARAEKFRLR